jgi:hypothetical protein
MHINPTAKIGIVIKTATHAKNQKIAPDTAAKSTHIKNMVKSRKIVRITETSQPRDCLM